MTSILRNPFVTGLTTVLLGNGSLFAKEKVGLSEQYETEILPILENYCYDCHGDGLKKGKLALDAYESVLQMISDRDRWQKIRDHIDFRLMPPPDEFAPSDSERAKLVKWIDNAVFQVDYENPDPGEIPLRRLNRTEYQNTIRDLLGVEIDAHEILPQDDSGYGFDNIGDVLSISALHMDRYLDAAHLGLEKALNFSPPRYPELVINGDGFKGSGSLKDDGRYFGVTGEDRAKFHIEKTGTYRISLMAGSSLCGDEFPKLEVRIGGQSLDVFEIPNPMSSLKEYSVEVDVERPGEHGLVLAFLNNLKDSSAPEGMRDRNILVTKIVVEGPLNTPPFSPPLTHLALLPERGKSEADEAYFDRVMGKFLPRAFRRPVAEKEIRRYRHFLDLAHDQDETFDSAILQALTAALVSPSFLFREEPSHSDESGKERSLITEHALASRLSYFLWSTMPDKHLRELADSNQLRNNLQSEIKRMIDSPKSDALIDNFVGQWLQLRDMSRIVPRRGNYFGINRRLPGYMRVETEMLVRHIIQENLPIHTLLSADFTFLNGPLARHYGIEGVEGEEFRKVSIAHTKRRGVLGHGSFLTLTSHQSKTSPVLRGKYVLENLLNTPPPPAPPNIPALEDRRDSEHSMTMRQELERHREDPACSSCHALMDPIGFGLENYDIVGRWRDHDNGKPIDPADTLVTGQKFASAEEMRDIFISDYKDDFQRAFAVKLLTYALGRGVEYYDRPAIDGIVLKGETGDGRFLSWINAVVEAVPFQYRRN